MPEIIHGSRGLAFTGIWLFSLLDDSERARIDRAASDHRRVRSETGRGAAEAAIH
jgi:hypothetical protein